MPNNALDRRHFLGAAALGLATMRPSTFITDEVRARRESASPPRRTASANVLTDVKQIDAGLLNIGYVDAGPSDGRVVMLLHGWPYDIQSYGDVVPLLTARGYRVIVPHLRGYGTTHFLSTDTARTAEQSAFAEDIVSLMDALHVQQAIMGGFDWGSRTAAILGTLWPERCKGLVCVSGYLITNLEANQQPLPPRAELGWWYQYYFATERGRRGYDANRHDFNKLIWQTASPAWHFDDATFDRTAASFLNPDHTDIVVHNYRWRLSLASGAPRYGSFEGKLAGAPVITVPTVTLASDFDGAAADGAAYAHKFGGRYAHHILEGIGHNGPQEAPRAFADAVVEVDSL